LRPILNALTPGGRANTRTLETAVMADRSYLNDLTQATAAFVTINPAHKAMIGQAFPPHADVPGIFVEADAIARKNGMTLVSIDTATDDTTVSSDGLKTVRVSVNITGGSYEQFKRYLNDMESSIR